MLLTLLGVASAWAQTAPTVQWQTSVPEAYYAKPVASARIVNAENGEFQTCITPQLGPSLLVRLLATGQFKVARALPGSQEFYMANQLTKTQDGGYLVSGIAKKIGSDDRVFLSKLDAQANEVWDIIDPASGSVFSPPTLFGNTFLVETANRYTRFTNYRYRSARGAIRETFTKNGQRASYPFTILDNVLRVAQDGSVEDAIEAVDGGILVVARFGSSDGLWKITEADTSRQLSPLGSEAFTIRSIVPTASRDGYFALYVNLSGSTVYLSKLRPNGSVVWYNILRNLSVTEPIKLVADANGVVVGGTNAGKLELQKYTLTGSIIWQTQLDGGPINSFIKTTDGGYAISTSAPLFIKLSPERNTTPPVGNFALTAPGYDCNTGQLTLNTTGGNGTTIDYRIVGLRDWASSNSFTVPTYQRNGTSFTLEARQSGQVITLGFTTACGTTTPPSTTTTTPPTGSFAVLTPGYDCNTGQLTAQVANAGSASVEYRIIGLRDWGSSLTFSVPTYQRTGTTFKVEARTSSGAYASTDFATACGTTTTTPSPLPSPININPASYTLVANVPYFNAPFELASGVYGAADSRLQNFIITATGLPPGMNLSINRLMGFFSVSITGQPTTVGVYPVTLTATDTSAPGSAPYATRVTITIVNGNTGTLALSLPSYGCQTGAITFYTTGGDGSVITYVAPGVSRSSATSNTGFVEAGLRADPKPLVIQATQSGQTVSYTFDFKAYCGGAGRLANAELGQRWQMELLGNPVEEQVQVRLSGSAGQTIQLRLSDAAGRAVSERTVQLQAEEQTETLRVGGSAGVYVLGAESQGQRQALKVLKK